MANEGKHYLKINDSICCRFNATVRTSGYNNEAKAGVQNPAFSYTSLIGTSTDSSEYYIYTDESANMFFSLAPHMGHHGNFTWSEFRHVTSNLTESNIGVTCDVNNLTDTGPSYNLSDNFSILTESEFLTEYLGGRYISTALVVILTIIYSIIFLTGVLGNLITCLVITRNRFLHTATNYYLFSLAISDVVTLLLALPPEMASIWEAYPYSFGIGFCFIKSYVSEMTSYASVLTITAFTIDRYVAICHPLKSQALSSLSRAVKIIICIWVVACVSALPYPIYTRTYYEVHDPCTGEPLANSYLCNIPLHYRARMTYMFQFSSFAFFILPMFIITIMYALIGITLMKTDNFSNKNKQAVVAAAKAKRAVLKMLVAVVIAFFLCWAPFHTQRLMTIYIHPEDWTDTFLQIQTAIFYISGVLYFFSSTVNPILYNVMSKRYRKAFRRTLYRCVKGSNYEYSETSIFRSTPHNTSVTVYTNHRLLVKDRGMNDDQNSSTTV